jgi:2-polyprenyl-3-methyl-5-hydroxy-6-metoxy-1,4-benzoquinol methylase
MTTKELHGIYHELNFWKGFVQSTRFSDGWVSRKKTPELNQFVADFIKSVPHETVLDIGSGVVSILNGWVNVIAADPLGDLYKLVFDYPKHKLTAPIPCPAEELEFKAEFDIVHCSNAIDHTQNPILAYSKMMDAVKPGGYLIIQGFENEGTFENWEGFHQNDISVEANTLCLKNQTGSISVIDTKPTHLEFVEANGKRWYIWIKQKS